MHKIGKIWGNIALKIAFVKVKYKEIGNFSKDEAYIIMPNHQSAFDIFTLFAYMPIEFRWVSKKENFEIPLVGWCMKIMNEISVEKSSIKELKNTLKQMERCINRGISIVIFPEGTRSKNGELLPFKKGGFFLALKSKRKILPVAIWGTKDIMKKGSLLVKPFKTINLIIGQPVDFEGKGNLEEKMKDFNILLSSLIKESKSLN